MRLLAASTSVFLALCLVHPGSTSSYADGAPPSTAKTRKQNQKGVVPSFPTGGDRPSASAEPYTRDPNIKEYRNALGQTVYAVGASRFDVSPPLSELAARRGADRAGDESESFPNEQIPLGRIVQSGVPDPVVQTMIPPVDALGQAPIPLAAPVTGFNFHGIGYTVYNPSDSNGSVGNNQFVETANSRYQVWTLNHATKIATPATAAANVNTLWAGFGGACEAQNEGDPVVLYDKVANRWLISQLTVTPAGGVYYECVAVSTTANATGSYARYAFAVPTGNIGDYPKYGVWTDAYYVTANTYASPGVVAAVFSAMDRTKMLAGDPTATWQVVLDLDERGHLPADLDGFALPPTNAPGIFLSLEPSEMRIFRLHVDFATPANTVRTLQAAVPVAPWTMPCGGTGLACIVQPGSGVTLASIGGPLMFRAAYRNFLDHESIVVSHAVDPGVAGVGAGFRWFDIRLSGTPNATCPTYPCLYQEGTIADVANGRSRWVPSIAMDTAENILIGYSTSGKVAGTENHSIRYTGRAKGDPPGVMTAPETTIINGTANFTGSGRWGDYTSMSVDPFDDCTFWYVNQYYTTTSAWSTQIASATFPAGNGPGQCPVTTCTTRPAGAAAIGSASATANNQITVSWTGIVPAAGAYAIERADGVCGSEGLYRPLGVVLGAATSFNDTSVIGGYSYSYRVIAATDAAGKCQAAVASGCVNATATGACTLKPSFAGASTAANNQESTCGVTIDWTPATSNCPLFPGMRYDVFRGTTPDFVPSGANRIATCVVGPSSYVDTANLASGTTYYYVVRAEDVSSGNGGECGGNEDANGVVVHATPSGVGLQAGPGTWQDGGGDGTSFLMLNVAGPGDTSQKAWRFVKTADDAGANHTPGGAYAYRNAGPSSVSTYGSNTCAETQTPSLTAATTTVNLQYWERHLLEYKKDAVAVEYAVNGGAWTDVPAPSDDPGLGCSATDTVIGWETLDCAEDPPTNACGYPDTKSVFTGRPAGGESCFDWVTNSVVTAYAHRCHPITGLAPGDTIQFRWRFASTPTGQYAGFYLDDIAVTNVQLPNACVPDACSGQSPPESQNVRAQADKTTYVWDPTPNSSQYDVLRGSLSALPVGPGGGDEVCFADLATPAVVDAATPAPGAGFWYLSRGEGACGIGTYGTRSNGTSRSSTTCP